MHTELQACFGTLDDQKKIVETAREASRAIKIYQRKQAKGEKVNSLIVKNLYRQMPDEYKDLTADLWIVGNINRRYGAGTVTMDYIEQLDDYEKALFQIAGE